MTFNEAQNIACSIRALGGPVQGRWLFELVKSTPDDCLICEVGTYYGYTSALLAMACLGTNRRVVQVDHMIGGYCDYCLGSKCVYLDVIDNMIRAGVWEKIIPMPMKSVDAIEMLKLIGKPIALAYLDGDHSYEGVLSELEKITPLIPVGGLICGDDCTLRDNQQVYHPSLTFSRCWTDGMSEQFNYVHPNPDWHGSGPPGAVWKFFRNNRSFEHLADAPGNQFGFRRVS